MVLCCRRRFEIDSTRIGGRVPFGTGLGLARARLGLSSLSWSSAKAAADTKLSVVELETTLSILDSWFRNLPTATSTRLG